MDWGLDEDTAAVVRDDSRPPERELVPEGDHPFQIKEVIDHGDKVELRLAHDDTRFGWVFARTPKDLDWGKRILSSLRQACGMTREEWAAGEITDLVGRRVRARIYHKAGNGRTFVNVAAFLPGENATRVETATAKPQVERAVAPPSSRAPVKRTATQQVDASSRMPGDDIPF
jgi:hypothetical protein